MIKMLKTGLNMMVSTEANDIRMRALEALTKTLAFKGNVNQL